MDGSRFDEAAKRLGAGANRRTVLKTMLAGAFGGAAMRLTPEPADAAGICRVVNQQCQRDSQCCSGSCGPANSLRRRYCGCPLGTTLCASTDECASDAALADIVVVKTDSASGLFVAGFCYQVFRQSDDGFVTGKCDGQDSSSPNDDGRTEISGLAQGDYYLVESTYPSGVCTQSAPLFFSIGPCETATTFEISYVSTCDCAGNPDYCFAAP